ncbi:hypothetical protein U2A4042360050 [Corynebacterium striatum]|nr:hypothetical protein U2A4042360050 [Corynebacterium striatum]
MGVVKPLHQVGVTRAARCRTHRKLAGGQGICLSGEGCGFLVADVNPVDRGAADCVNNRVQGVTHEAINALDTLRLESFYELFCVIFRHITASFRISLKDFVTRKSLENLHTPVSPYSHCHANKLLKTHAHPTRVTRSTRPSTGLKLQ